MQIYCLYQTLAAFDSGWKQFPHHYLLYAAQGAFQLEVATLRWLLPPQRAAWIAAHVPIRIHCQSAVVCSSLIVPPSSFDLPIADCRVFSVSAMAQAMLEHAKRWPQSAEFDPKAERFLLALADVCLELATQPDNFWLPVAQSTDLQLALDYSLAQLEQPITLAMAAQAGAMAERTLARRCASELGLSWRAYLHRARMIRATELLLASNLPILEVALAIGFESVTSFSSAFRQFSGQAPRQFRQGYA
ncbi:AraC family transcriptional regulator [Herpetosiphon geysericola]|uniref:AraC family transcriptional regulator n=1 Tax=Herpetosiphon geysericola TaxID=70996 RepID=UPI0006C8F802|nr:helix-turn-helix domain-containing protein [Herpetosiphon geysericola]